MNSIRKNAWIMALGIILGLSGCYNDDDLWNAVNKQEERIAALENWQKTANENIAALQTIVSQNDYITDVKPLTENGETVGYTISFLKQNPIVIRNGAKGEAGTAGATPTIGVTLLEDGKYYWTLNGELMKDTVGNTICANGLVGENGVEGKPAPTPILKAGSSLTDADVADRDATAVYLSVDGGKTWVKVSGPKGDTGPAGPAGASGATGSTGAAGSDGDSFFSSVDASNDNYVVFTLADGTTIAVPRYSAFTLTCNGQPVVYGEVTVMQGSIATLQYTGIGMTVTATVNGTAVSFNTNHETTINTNVSGDLLYRFTAIGKDNKESIYVVTVHVTSGIIGSLVAALTQQIPTLTTTNVNGNLVILVTENSAIIAGVTSLDLSNQNLTSLAGLENFSNLQTLDVSNNLLPSIDPTILAAMPNLTTFTCDNYGGGATISTPMPILTNSVFNNGGSILTRAIGGTLDVSNNPKLKFLSCSNNNLTALLFPPNEQTFQLKTLDCSNNQITTLEVTACPSLENLNCSGNQLASLDVTANTSLKVLDCASNQITILNVSVNVNLQTLLCNDNQLATLDISLNLKIEKVVCGNQAAADGSQQDIIISANADQKKEIDSLIKQDDKNNVNVLLPGSNEESGVNPYQNGGVF